MLLFAPMKIKNNLLSYNNKLETRDLSIVDTLVIHCTELPNLELAREFGEEIHYASGTGNSGHFYIDKDGQVEQWVKINRIAHHVSSHNQNSIGIELSNLGRFPHWHKTTSQIMYDDYPEAQINTLNKLIIHLEKQVPSLKYITGHEDLDKRTIPSSDNPEILIRRKMDPGHLFPWEHVLQSTQLEYNGDFGDLK